MQDLSAFQRDLLYVVAGLEKPHGLAVKEQMEEYYDKKINHGRLYPNLNEIAETGLIEKGERDARSNWYSVTEEGVEALDRRNAWQRDNYKPNNRPLAHIGGK